MHRFLEQYFGIIKKFLPTQSEESSVGIDIGVSSCKLVELVASPLSLKVKNWGILPVQSGDVASTIKKLLAQTNASPSNVYTALSGQGTLIRFIKMPRMPLNQLRESLLLEADKYFPFSKDQVYMDCHILDDKRGKDNKMEVLVAVAKRDLVKQRLDLIESLGLKGGFIGISAVALSNAFSKIQKILGSRQGANLKDVNRTIAVLDIGEVKSSLIIFAEGLPRFTRDISLGGKDLTQKISNVMGINFSEAEKVKCGPKGKEEDIITACHSTLLSLVSEIRLSFDYFTSENSQEVKALYLMGSSSKIPKIDDFFVKELDLAVEKWDSAKALEFVDNVSAAEFSDQANQLGVALGLSLYSYD
ncbi:MAG: type IV pilus assembly protein PilM [Candidatus Aceula meridiana]|nr:type IV pilus assembly protein PilM [Candidatus Aceula meridiana]